MKTVWCAPRRLDDAMHYPEGFFGRVKKFHCSFCNTPHEEWSYRCSRCWEDEVIETQEWPPFIVTNRRRVPLANRPPWA